MQTEDQSQQPSNNNHSHSHTHTHTHHSTKKKRVGKACDSCRIKKTKCDGKKPCNKCILDNKICVFTEKRKPKEKNHPPGYVELLETRLDILTKSFEKLIELSQPHLPFISEIINSNKSTQYESSSPSSSISDNEYEEDSIIPINKIVSYLIEQRGLLKNLPMEWEQGAIIAANYNYKKNFDSSVKLFAQHKYDTTTNTSTTNTDLNSPLVSPEFKPKKTRHTKTKIKQEFSPSSHTSSFDNQFTLDNIHIEPISSDIDSDSPPVNKVSPEPSQTEYLHKRAGSLFNQDLPKLSKMNSISSLTNKYEDHTLSSPTNTTFFNNAPVINTLRRTSSASSNKIQKPPHHYKNLSLDSKRTTIDNTSMNNILINPTNSYFNYQDESNLYDQFDDATKSLMNNYTPILQSQQPVDHQPFLNSQNLDILVGDPNLDHFVSNNNPFMGNFR
ncbi:unnamed protein product [Candida verbasci]|uniref:Zn(2)-C6 fungal-type domain-containing protein n=1 Tax=Candida verbasci TaxID=1227364 RepID=A0A9W4XLI4_9ASCO|nr:unnamed protein product [Candida verbasci]